MPQGPGGFQNLNPKRLNVPVLPHDNELMLVHGFAGGAPPVTRVAFVIQLLCDLRKKYLSIKTLTLVVVAVNCFTLQSTEVVVVGNK